MRINIRDDPQDTRSIYKFQREQDGEVVEGGEERECMWLSRISCGWCNGDCRGCLSGQRLLCCASNTFKDCAKLGHAVQCTRVHRLERGWSLGHAVMLTAANWTAAHSLPSRLWMMTLLSLARFISLRISASLHSGLDWCSKERHRHPF